MATYEIIIKDETKGNVSNTNISNEDNATKTKETNESQESSINAKAIGQVALNTAKTLVISKVGDFTRDNLLQQKINFGISSVMTINSFLINPVYGSINLATQMASSLLDYSIDLQKETNLLRIQSARAGYINRSRD